jgi:hypothetical protein
MNKSIKNPETLDFFGKKESIQLPIVKCKFEKQDNISIYDMFHGYKTLYGTTYSCDLNFLGDILPFFEYVEILLGSPQIINDQIIGVFSVDMVTEEYLRPFLSKKESIAYKMYEEERLKFYVSHRLSHGKSFFLDGDIGCRVILGSANMTAKGFSGQQNEFIGIFDNDRDCYNSLKPLYFDHAKDNSDIARCIPKKIILCDNSENNIIPQSVKEVVITKKAFIIADPTPTTGNEMADMICDIQRYAKEYKKNITSQDVSIERGKVILKPDVITKIEKRVAIEKEAEIKNSDSSHFTNLTIDFDNNKIYLRDENIINNYNEDNVQNDINIIKEYFNGLTRPNFTRDIDWARRDYYKLLNYLFVSPFMSFFRNIYLKNNAESIVKHKFHHFAILYGASGSGKTATVNFILTLMGKANYNEKKTRIINRIIGDCFENDTIKGLWKKVNGLPLFIDELSTNKFGHHQSLIKDEIFGRRADEENYPACVITINKVKTLLPEVKIRSIALNIDTVFNAKIKDKGIAFRLTNRITGDLYIKYLNILFPIMSKLLDECKGDITGEKDIDLYHESSKVLYELLDDKSSNFVIPLTIEDYFGDGRKGNKIIKELIENYQQYKTKYFKILKKIKTYPRIIFLNETEYDKENRDRAMELPSIYEAIGDQHGVSMRYDLLREDFREFAGIRI